MLVRQPTSESNAAGTISTLNKTVPFGNPRQLSLDFSTGPSLKATPAEFIALRARQIPILFVRNPRARRYIIRLRRDGSARVTIPRGGSAAEARRFAERNVTWLEQQLHALPRRHQPPAKLTIGSEVLFRGDLVKIEADVTGPGALLRLGDETITFLDPDTDLRPAVEAHLRRIAARELPRKVYEYATKHNLTVRKVTVRNQRSRWGSCSRRAAISLNWRLIQTPPFVSNYVVVHELMHLRQMNHSPRFWAEVERAFPDYKTAVHWLKTHAVLIR